MSSLVSHRVKRSVVVGRDESSEPQRDYQAILDHEIAAGVRQFGRSKSGLALSSLSAGLDIGFGPLLMVAVLTLFAGRETEPVVRLLVANAYAVGFIFVILGRSELFTEHTTLAVLPVLDGKASVSALGRLWGLVWLANIIGTLFFSWFAVLVTVELGVASVEAFSHIASELIGPAWWAVTLSAVLAGWLMGLLSWLVSAGRDTISQILFVWLVTALIGFFGLHHSIAGSVEVLMGVFVESGASWSDYGFFLIWATVGNAIGGVVFGALLKYGHVTVENL